MPKHVTQTNALPLAQGAGRLRLAQARRRATHRRSATICRGARVICAITGAFPPLLASPEALGYTEFKHAGRDGRIARVTFERDRIRGRFVADEPPQQGEGPGTSRATDAGPAEAPTAEAHGGRFTSTMPQVEDPELLALLEKQGVESGLDDVAGLGNAKADLREMAESPEYCDATAKLIDDEVKRLIEDIEQGARKLMEANRDRLDHLVEALLEAETLGRDRIDELLGAAPDREQPSSRGSFLRCPAA